MDTGSAASIVSREFLKTFPSLQFPISKEDETYLTLSEEKTLVKEGIIIPVIVGKKEYQLDLKIVEKATLKFDIILGRD